MSNIDYVELTRYAKSFTGLTPDKEALLQQLGPAVVPGLSEVTDKFYATLQQIPKAAVFLEGRVEHLKRTHAKWLESLFTGPYDDQYAQKMYEVGNVHVKVNLPVEFMSGGMTLIQSELLPVLARACDNDAGRLAAAASAVTSIVGFSLLVMQESYQTGKLAEELEKFLAISGMSRTLFNNLAAAYGK